jgi:hypothetical protein
MSRYGKHIAWPLATNYEAPSEQFRLTSCFHPRVRIGTRVWERTNGVFLSLLDSFVML